MAFSPFPSPGGSLRNTLGSELKRRGIFQKNGRIRNLRGGVLGPQHKIRPFIDSKQLILEPAQPGVGGSGFAAISPYHVFSLIAHLPDPQLFMGYGSYVYAAYLIDHAGNSFLLGVLRPGGTGTYELRFPSPVPLMHYDKVIVSMENPMQIGPRPSGPIVLQVRDSMGTVGFFHPLKAIGEGIWRKVSSLFRSASAAGRDGSPASPPESGSAESENNG